jgi:hypothetical protein
VRSAYGTKVQWCAAPTSHSFCCCGQTGRCSDTPSPSPSRLGSQEANGRQPRQCPAVGCPRLPGPAVPPSRRPPRVYNTRAWPGAFGAWREPAIWSGWRAAWGIPSSAHGVMTQRNFVSFFARSHPVMLMCLAGGHSDECSKGIRRCVTWRRHSRHSERLRHPCTTAGTSNCREQSVGNATTQIVP